MSSGTVRRPTFIFMKGSDLDRSNSEQNQNKDPTVPTEPPSPSMKSPRTPLPSPPSNIASVPTYTLTPSSEPPQTVLKREPSTHLTLQLSSHQSSNNTPMSSPKCDLSPTSPVYAANNLMNSYKTNYLYQTQVPPPGELIVSRPSSRPTTTTNENAPQETKIRRSSKHPKLPSSPRAELPPIPVDLSVNVNHSPQNAQHRPTHPPPPTSSPPATPIHHSPPPPPAHQPPPPPPSTPGAGAGGHGPTHGGQFYPSHQHGTHNIIAGAPVTEEMEDTFEDLPLPAPPSSNLNATLHLRPDGTPMTREERMASIRERAQTRRMTMSTMRKGMITTSILPDFNDDNVSVGRPTSASSVTPQSTPSVTNTPQARPYGYSVSGTPQTRPYGYSVANGQALPTNVHSNPNTPVVPVTQGLLSPMLINPSTVLFSQNQYQLAQNQNKPKVRPKYNTMRATIVSVADEPTPLPPPSTKQQTQTLNRRDVQVLQAMQQADVPPPPAESPQHQHQHQPPATKPLLQINPSPPLRPSNPNSNRPSRAGTPRLNPSSPRHRPPTPSSPLPAVPIGVPPATGERVVLVDGGNSASGPLYSSQPNKNTVRDVNRLSLLPPPAVSHGGRVENTNLNNISVAVSVESEFESASEEAFTFNPIPDRRPHSPQPITPVSGISLNREGGGVVGIGNVHSPTSSSAFSFDQASSPRSPTSLSRVGTNSSVGNTRTERLTPSTVREFISLLISRNKQATVLSMLEKYPGLASAIDGDGRPVLYHALIVKDEVTIKRLIELGADCSILVANYSYETDFNPTIRTYLSKNPAKYVRDLTIEPVNVNTQIKVGNSKDEDDDEVTNINNSATLLHIAIDRRSTMAFDLILRALLSRNTNNPAPSSELPLKAILNYKDCHGRTPFHLACMYNNATIASRLLNNHVDITIEDNRGKNALITVTEMGHLDFFKTILRDNPGQVDLNRLDSLNRNPLLISMIEKNDNLTRTLLKFNANPNHTNAQGDTLLMIAANKQLSEICFNLIQHHANPCAVNDRKAGISALSYAVKTKCANTVKSLLQQKACVNNVYFCKDATHNHELIPCLPEERSIRVDATPLALACHNRDKIVLELLCREHCSDKIMNFSVLYKKDYDALKSYIKSAKKQFGKESKCSIM